MVYGIPAGPTGERMAGLLTAAFRQRVEEDIHHYREYLETEIDLHAH